MAHHAPTCLSPHHAFYFEGVLVKVKDLVNGLTIIRDNRI